MCENSPVYCRSKIWLEDQEGNVVFGLGRLRILEAIKTHGSIQAAAKELKMGYRAMWARITATEKRLGQMLLVRQAGGSSGGGSRLTPLAEDLIRQFRRIQQHIEEETDLIFAKDLGQRLDIRRNGRGGG